MWVCTVIFLFCVTVPSTVLSARESRLVFINSGPIRGYKMPRSDVFEFHGIPYARVPTGDHRFKAPLPPPVWYATFEAVDKGIVCPQLFVLDDISNTPLIKEDCLIANVFVPTTKKKNLPVVIYVHGGAFVAGYGNLVNPSQFVSGRDIIAVTFNYRLSALGFLCLGTEDIPGNAGMKDQVALLRWVKKNIASFGGNPNDVTLSGYSAGSSAVDLLMISKMAEGLFHKIIPESGSSISPYSVQIDPIETAKKYANLIGNNNVDDIYQLEHFFKRVPYEILQSGNVLYQKNNSGLSVCIERDLGQEMFLEDDPVNILRKGNFLKLPILYGFANMEGSMFITVFDFWKNYMTENFADFVPADLHFKNNEEKVLVANTIREFYFGNRSIDNNSIIDYIDYFSETMFICPTLRVINHLIKAGHDQIYLYVYSFTDENSFIIPYTNIRGTTHCDQTVIVQSQYKENIYSNPLKVTKDYKEMQNMMRELWVKFIKNGKPEASGVPTWPSVSKNGSPHMVLKKIPELGALLSVDRCLFWDKIYRSYYRFPSSP